MLLCVHTFQIVRWALPKPITTESSCDAADACHSFDLESLSGGEKYAPEPQNHSAFEPVGTLADGPFHQWHPSHLALQHSSFSLFLLKN
jgi:hypothetical protein